MLKYFQLVCIASGAIFVASCASTRVLSDYDMSVDFDEYKTFNWLPALESVTSSDGLQNTIVDKRFRRNLREILEYKKYRMDTVMPDFHISYNTNVREREGVSYSNSRCFSHGYHGRHHGHFHSAHDYFGGYSTYVYDETMITIDIFDAKKSELIWRGWTSKQSYGPSLSETYIQEAVEEILSQFPPSIQPDK